MSKIQKILTAVFSVVLCIMFVLSVVDTNELRQSTNFSQDNILTHIEKLSENGPRSLVHTDANRKAMEYIVSCVERSGAVQEDTTDKPAYLVQDYVGVDADGVNQNFYLSNVIVHIPANSPDKTGGAVMFMGHFDSVPMGQGSSDDGVACSVMLEAIRYYTEKISNGYTLSNDLVFCFVNGEEYDMFGSRAFMNEFKGFDNIVDRIRFGVNLESRGTSGTVIMFETGKNNYNTVKLFSEVNKSIFTCSIATMIYDMMPNYTDFTNFKEVYQGVNMANIGGGENYHTQNDNPEKAGKVYISQQAQIVDGLISRLSDYDLEKLYDADESAIFFSYLNVTTVIYNHTIVIVLAVLAIIFLIANIVLSIYRKDHKILNTVKAFGAMAISFALSALVTFGLYYLFQLVATLAGVIDINMIGTITYSNVALVMAICLVTLASVVVTAHFTCKWFKIEARDLRRAFAYTHIVLGIALSFFLADASYLFILSGILYTTVELVSIFSKKFEDSHPELIVTALYMPIVIPVLFLATSALGMTMAYVYGIVCVLALFDAGLCLVPVCRYLSVRSAVKALKKKPAATSPWEGALHIFASALVILTVVSVSYPNANVNLQGKQNIAKLPYDDALVYVVDENGNTEYRIYDLNAYRALKDYAPEMEYEKSEDLGYYRGEGEEKTVNHSILSTNDEMSIDIRKTAENSLIYLEFKDATGKSFTIDDGRTKQVYEFDENGEYPEIKLHSDCVVTLSDGSAKVSYKELIIDYETLIPEAYANDTEKLHFNLWLAKNIALG